MLDTIANLPTEEALAVLAEAGRPLRPTAPGQVRELSQLAEEALVEAYKQVHFGDGRPLAVGLEALDSLSESERGTILDVLTENITTLALEGVDRDDLLAGLDDGYEGSSAGIDSPGMLRRFKDIVTYYGKRQATIATIAVGLAIVAAAQHRAIDGLRKTLVEQGTKLAAEIRRANVEQQRNGQLQQENEGLKKQIEQRHDEQESTVPVKPESNRPGAITSPHNSISCGGGLMAVDSSGDLTIYFPSIKSGDGVLVTLDVKGRAGELAEITWRDSGIGREEQEREIFSRQKLSYALKEITKIVVVSPSGSFSCPIQPGARDSTR